MATVMGVTGSQDARTSAIIDLLIVALVGVAGVRLALQGALLQDPPRRPPSLIQPGSFFSVPDTLGPHASTTVVLFAVKDCFATLESVAFYKTLARRIAALPGVTFFVLSPDPTDSTRSWLKANEVQVQGVAQIPDPAAVGLLLSPTVLVLNGGIADTVLAGRLLPSEEAAILARVTRHEPQEPIGNVPNEIDERDLGGLLREDEVQVVDVSERTPYLKSHRSGSLNIPLVELPVRARIELNVRRHLILERPPPVAPLCPAAGTFLR